MLWRKRTECCDRKMNDQGKLSLRRLHGSWDPKDPKEPAFLKKREEYPRLRGYLLKAQRQGRADTLGDWITLPWTTVGIWGSLLSFLFIKYSLITSTVWLRINNLSFLVSRIHHLEFPSLKMWTFAIIVCSSDDLDRKQFHLQIFLISRIPCVQALNSFKMLRILLPF